MLLHAISVALLMQAAPGGTAAAGAAHPDTLGAARAGADSTHAPVQTLQEILDQANAKVASHGGARADSARLYLRWNAPYGMPRASTTRTPRAHDPNAADTLWLSFLAGRAGQGFQSFAANLYFRAAPGDTLGPWWHMEGTGQNKGALTVEFGPDATFPQAQPWTTHGNGLVRLNRTAASARLLVVWAVPYAEAAPVSPDSVYTLCRVVLNHRRVLPGCSQPVCVEWANAQLGYWLNDEPIVDRGERFVSYASGADVCDSYQPMGEPSPAPVAPAAPARRPRPRRLPPRQQVH